MKRIYIILILAVSALGMISCQKFLEPQSQFEYTPKTAVQLNELIIDGLITVSDDISNLLEVVTDNMETAPFISYPSSSSYPWYDDGQYNAMREIYSWQPSYYSNMRARGYSQVDMYSHLYNRLARANVVIDYIPKVSGSQQDKDWVEAQALAMRGFIHLQLVNIYGEPYHKGRDAMGIALRRTAAKTDDPIVRSTVGEVYDLIIEDLSRAETLFRGLEAEDRKFRQWRPTLPMVLHTLCRAYLYMGEWSESARYGQMLITEWPRFRLENIPALVDNGYNNVHYTGYTSSGPFGASRDRQRYQKFYDFMSYSSPEIIWLYGSGEKLSHVGNLNLGINNQPASVNGSRPYIFRAAQDLIDSYEADDDRLRTYYIRDLWTEFNYTNSSTTTQPTKPVKFRAYSKVNLSGNGEGYPTSNLLVPVSGGGNREIGQAFRISEIYLSIAEAGAMMYRDNASAEGRELAISALNTLRRNRIRNYTDLNEGSFASADDLVAFVRDERRRELSFEGLRWFDLRRWNDRTIEHRWVANASGTIEVFTLAPDDPSYTFPLPDNVFVNNQQMEQVPLYNGGGNRMPTRVE